jgi:hypothetical protein
MLPPGRPRWPRAGPLPGAARLARLLAGAGRRPLPGRGLRGTPARACRASLTAVGFGARQPRARPLACRPRPRRSTTPLGQLPWQRSRRGRDRPAPLRYVGVRPIDSSPVDGPPSSAHSGRNSGGGRLGRPAGPGALSRVFQKTSLRLRRHSHISTRGVRTPTLLGWSFAAGEIVAMTAISRARSLGEAGGRGGQPGLREQYRRKLTEATRTGCDSQQRYAETASSPMHSPEVRHRVGMAGSGGSLVPFPRCGGILIVQQRTEVVHGVGVACALLSWLVTPRRSRSRLCSAIEGNGITWSRNVRGCSRRRRTLVPLLAPATARQVPG